MSRSTLTLLVLAGVGFVAYKMYMGQGAGTGGMASPEQLKGFSSGGAGAAPPSNQAGDDVFNNILTAANNLFAVGKTIFGSTPATQ